MKQKDEIASVISFIVMIIFVALVFLLVMPFVQIWAVNTLFKTDIEYSWLNWFAAVLLNSSIKTVNYCGGRSK